MRLVWRDLSYRMRRKRSQTSELSQQGSPPRLQSSVRSMNCTKEGQSSQASTRGGLGAFLGFVFCVRGVEFDVRRIPNAAVIIRLATRESISGLKLSTSSLATRTGHRGRGRGREKTLDLDQLQISELGCHHNL
jgi:hypothetical protein